MISVTATVKKTCGFSMSTSNQMPATASVPVSQCVLRLLSKTFSGTFMPSVSDAVASQPTIESGTLEAATGTQCRPVHSWVAQSEFCVQASATLHLLGQLAPQSTVGSVPFSTPSLHVGAAHLCVARVHTRLAQSLATRQAARAAQPLQLPPQSTSVSLPLSTPSLQLVGWQLPIEQLAWSQSALTKQCCIVAQRVQLVLPPQSMSLSS